MYRYFRLITVLVLVLVLYLRAESRQYFYAVYLVLLSLTVRLSVLCDSIHNTKGKSIHFQTEY